MKVILIILAAVLAIAFIEAVKSAWWVLPLVALIGVGGWLLSRYQDRKQAAKNAQILENLRRNQLQQKSEAAIKLQNQREEQLRHVEIIKQQQAILEVERQKTLRMTKKAFEETLESIPKNIIRTDRYIDLKPNNENDIPEIRYSGIGAKADLLNLSAFVVIDTETTGLSPTRHSIIELSAIMYQDFRPVMCWSTLINPLTYVNAEATRINHITNEMVKCAPTLDDVALDFMDFIGDLPVMGYNVKFDLRFLYTSGIDLISDNRRRFYDVYSIAKNRYGYNCQSYKLANLSQYLGIDVSNAHRSLADAYATGCCFCAIVNDILQGNA